MSEFTLTWDDLMKRKGAAESEPPAPASAGLAETQPPAPAATGAIGELERATGKEFSSVKRDERSVRVATEPVSAKSLGLKAATPKASDKPKDLPQP
jgi:hypothetical protein